MTEIRASAGRRLTPEEFAAYLASHGPTYSDVSIPDIGPYGTATNRGSTPEPYPMGGLFGPALPPSVNPAVPKVAAPVSPDAKTDNPVRDAIVAQLLSNPSNQGGEQPGGYGPDFGMPDFGTPDVATPDAATPTTGPFGEDSAGSGKPGAISPAEANAAAKGSPAPPAPAPVGQPVSLADQAKANEVATKGTPAEEDANEMNAATVQAGKEGFLGKNAVTAEQSLKGYFDDPFATVDDMAAVAPGLNNNISMTGVVGSPFGSFAPGTPNTPANTSFAPATPAIASDPFAGKAASPADEAQAGKASPAVAEAINAHAGLTQAAQEKGYTERGIAPDAPPAPEAPAAPGLLGSTTQQGQLAGITQSQAIADEMANNPAFAAQVSNPVGFTIGKGINEAMPSNLYGQLDTVQAPMTVFSNIALENPGKTQSKTDMTVEEALDAVFGTLNDPGWSISKSSPENPDPDTGLTVGLSPPDTGMFGDVGITAAPGATLGPTSSPGAIAAFGDALAGAEAAQAQQGAPSGDAPAGAPGTTGEAPGTSSGSSATGSTSGDSPGTTGSSSGDGEGGEGGW